MDYSGLLKKHPKKYAERVPWRYAELRVSRLLVIHPDRLLRANVERITKDIAENGIRWPVCAHYRRGGLRIIVGRHRVAAAQVLGLETIKAVIWDVQGDYPAPLIDDPLSVFGPDARLNKQKGLIVPSDRYFGNAP